MVFVCQIDLENKNMKIYYDLHQKVQENLNISVMITCKDLLAHTFCACVSIPAGESSVTSFKNHRWLITTSNQCFLPLICWLNRQSE